MPEFSIITSFLGQTKDRFHVYNTPKSLDEKFAIVASIPDTTGVEVVFPYEADNPAELTRTLGTHGLQLSAINVNIKGEPEFVAGSITSPKKAVRDKAVQFIKRAKDFAETVGAPRVTCCPLGDGFEFPFEADYQAAWTRLADTIGEAASYKPEMPLFLEYKPKETRGRCFLNRAADTLVLLNILRIPGLGVTMDYGHSVYGGESPGEVVCMLEDSDFDYYVHINDNDSTWDWDFFCGSHTFLTYVEFIYYLKKLGYDKHLTSDSHPTRWDMKEMFTINARVTTKIWNLLDQIGMKELTKRIGTGDYLTTWRFLEENVLGLR